MSGGGWIGVDLDGTLAHYEGWTDDGAIGKPIPLMVERVKKWLAKDKDVKIFTARVALMGRNVADVHYEKDRIQDWCEEHLGKRLEVTCEKDFSMYMLWDDRCVQVQINTGIRIGDQRPGLVD